MSVKEREKNAAFSEQPRVLGPEHQEEGILIKKEIGYKYHLRMIRACREYNDSLVPHKSIYKSLRAYYFFYTGIKVTMYIYINPPL